MTTSRWIMVERDGCLWLLGRDRIRHLRREGSRVLVHTVDDGSLWVDRVMPVEGEPVIRPVGEMLRPLVPRGCTGLGLCEHGPRLVLDPTALGSADAVPPVEGKERESR